MSRQYAILSASEKFKVDFREVLETYNTVRTTSANDLFIVKYDSVPNSFNYLTPDKSGLTLSNILTTVSSAEWNNFDFENRYPNVPKEGLAAFFNFDTSLTASDFYYSKVIKGETLSITLTDFPSYATNYTTFNPNGILNENGTTGGKTAYYGQGSNTGAINLFWDTIFSRWELEIIAYGLESYDNLYYYFYGLGDTQYPWQAKWGNIDGKVLRTPNASDVELDYIELEPTGSGGVYTYGVPYSGVSFEQQGDRLIYPYNLWNQQENPTSFTAAFWVRRDIDFVPAQPAFICGSAFGPMNFSFTENYGENFNEYRGLTFGIRLTGGNYKEVRCTKEEVVLSKGIWTHLAGTLDIKERVIKLYINGKLGDTNSYSSSDRPGVAYIGGTPSHTDWDGFALNGSVLQFGAEYGNEFKFDNFGLWKRALKDTEISSLYNHGYGALYQ